MDDIYTHGELPYIEFGELVITCYLTLHDKHWIMVIYYLNNVMNVWNERCANKENIIRICEHVMELYDVRDGCGTSRLNK